MLTRFVITRRADDDGVDAAVVERDYTHRYGSRTGPGHGAPTFALPVTATSGPSTCINAIILPLTGPTQT